MSLPLLRAIHAHGESLREALEAGDLAATGPLAAERQALVDDLLAAARPSPLPAAWSELGEALAAQNRLLGDLLAARERELSEAMAQASRHRKAHRSYGTPAGPSAERLQAVHG